MEIRRFVIALSAIFLIASCAKNDGEFVGSYTYKLSGTLTLAERLPAGSTDVPDTLAYSISSEQGQLNVVKDGDAYVLTFNNMLGGGDVARATESGGVLSVTSTAPKSVRGEAVNGSSLGSVGGLVTFTAAGHKYDNMLILDYVMAGELKKALSDTTMTIVETNVNCIAKKN